MPDIQNIKFKKLTEQQVIISIDRLTRFKPTEEKYLRVFSDIITSNLIEPHLKKNDIQNMNYEVLKDIVVKIFNSSIESETVDLSINEKLKEYENSVFYNNKQTQILLDNKLDYTKAIPLIQKDAPKNLQWLKKLSSNENNEWSTVYNINF